MNLPEFLDAMIQADIDFITNARHEAQLAEHVFPLMAACEAALESSYGRSLLAIQGNNLFGMKQHTRLYGDLVLPTREFQNGEWTVVSADFVSYPNQAECFVDRMNTLVRLQTVYPNYHYALTAATADAYVLAVSKTWATDPGRAAAVLAIYDEYNQIQAASENLGA